MEVTISAISAAATRPLRQRVLRPHQHVEELVYTGDDAPMSAHYGAYAGGSLVGVASIYVEASTEFAGPHAWRLRGMAVAPEFQGCGIGGTLLQTSIRHAAEAGGAVLWCQARPRAVPFYERHGFTLYSEPFDVPGIGPHLLMAKTLDSGR